MKKMLRITQVRSRIGHPDKHTRVLDGLGLRRIGQTVLREDTPAVRGMVAKVQHLVTWESIEGAEHEAQ
ncbi:MAG: 50S ribosomal protein L30 [Candidatus Schekmanbacteria bacterium]|nr:50S ribosomal protein L30 [Candidatus Schekmanbacteria bacterium]